MVLTFAQSLAAPGIKCQNRNTSGRGDIDVTVAMMDDTTRALALDLLAWYQAVGVDEAHEDIAVDWMGRGETGPGRPSHVPNETADAIAQRPSFNPRSISGPASQAPSPPQTSPRVAGLNLRAQSTPQSTPQAPRQFPTTTPDESLVTARDTARAAATLDALGEALAKFDGCALKATAKNLCFYRGASKARLMLIGEAPGRDEDIEGRPFVGRAGQLLDKMLGAIGLAEPDVHITNIVYWRPPGNRTPSLVEAQVCRPFVERQIELVEPDVIVLLGGAAAKSMLGVEEGIMRLRGKWREIEVAGRTIRTMATLHPAYLLRTPAQKRLAWRDLLAISTSLPGK